MQLHMTLYTDDDGFLRRECPNCERQFKWFAGETADRPDDVPDPDVYFCPYCGESAPNNEWWTQQQLEQARGEIAGPAMQMLVDELQKGLSSGRSKGLLFKAGKVDAPAPPPPLTEPNDMVMVEPPCHPWEPLKINEDWGDVLHCLLCGSEFAI